jgi:hypothetical protein
METGVATYRIRWALLRIFSATWILLTLISITVTLPPTLLPVGIIGSVFGISTGLIAVLNGRWVWSEVSLLDGGLMFLVLLLEENMSKTVEQNLPVMLLQFMMLLFAVEVLSVVSKQHGLFSKVLIETEGSVSILARSIHQALRRTARLGLLFASSYFISIAILYVGAYIAPLSPILSDISFYIVIVSVSLALLIILREE